MDLVDRYARAVAKALPEAQRDDIIGELSEDIRSEIEDKQRELDRPLTQDEQEALLKQRGNPLLVAARFRQDRRSVAFGKELIGPVLFPFYAKVLSFNLGLTFFIVAIIFAALAISGQKIGLHDIISTCLLQLFIQLGVVTLIFWLVQRHLTKHPDRWHLKGMRGGIQLELDIERDILSRIERNLREVSRFESLSIIVASVVALVWLTEVQRYPFLILGPAALFLKPAPIWYQIYLPIVLFTAAEILRATVNLFRPDWINFRAIARVVMHVGGLAVIYFLLKAGSWVSAFGSTAGAVGNYARSAAIVNQCFYYGLLGAAVFSVVMIVLRITELIRRRSWRNASQNVSAAAKQGN